MVAWYGVVAYLALIPLILAVGSALARRVEKLPAKPTRLYE